jgi:predicted metal-dependent hydrolase
VSKKSAKIAALIENCQGRELPAHYLGYFECFNRGLFYEAHDVLEELWLPARHGPDGKFYQGLIQLAGAFVHLQKDRLRPAAALFEKATANLKRYPPEHHSLNVAKALNLAEQWSARLHAAEFAENPLRTQRAPQLNIESGMH